MNERELKLIGAVAGVGLLLFILLNGAYDRGYSAAVAQGDNPNAVFYDHGPGPLPVLLIAGVVLFFLWRRRSGPNGSPNGGFDGGPMGGGPRGPQPPRFFQEWHAQAHAGGPQATQTTAPQAQEQRPDQPQVQGPAMPPPPPAPPTDETIGGVPPMRPGPHSGTV